MIAHGSKEFCEVTPTGLVDHPKEACTGARRTETCVALRHVDASRNFHSIFSERVAWGGGGGGIPDFSFALSCPCSACPISLLDSIMRRSPHRYIYVTQQGTGLKLPCLALIHKYCLCTPFGQRLVQYQVTLLYDLYVYFGIPSLYINPNTSMTPVQVP